ncbi:MAG: GNAT family N-acetyltransferase [Pseudomonadota bacterium]
MNERLNIRDANPDDLEDIRELNRQIFEYEFEQCEKTSNVEYPDQHDGTKYYLQLVYRLDGFVAFVAEIHGKVVGYAGVRLVPDTELTHRNNVKLAQLHTLSVDKEFRNKGIGRALIDRSVAFAQKSGANRMRVIAYALNDRARHLYRAVGFTESEIVHEMPI